MQPQKHSDLSWFGHTRLRSVPLQNSARAFTSTKILVHLTIFYQEIASPTLSSIARKIVTQWF